jgi:dolichol-phosphate mannosyltransferase
VIGSRNFSKLNSNSLSSIRVFFSKPLIYILGLVSGKNFIDPMSGFFIFKRELYFNNKKNFYGKGYKILADFIYNIPKLKINEITIKF